MVPNFTASANNTAQTLPFSQNWTDTNLITVNDNWSGVNGIIGYLGDTLTSVNDVDPQTVLSFGTGTEDAIANLANPSGSSSGGVAEAAITDPVIALQGSGTADAPFILIHLDTTGAANIQISYNLRDIDGSADNAVQQVALQYRIGNTGDFTNVPAGYVSDATTGPSLATQVTPVSVSLPAGVNNQPLIEIRIITTNATGNDEWVGIDDISITGTPLPDSAPTVTSTTPADGAEGVAVGSNITINFSESVNATSSSFTISCSLSGVHAIDSFTSPASSFILDPDDDFYPADDCEVTVVAANISDADANDPPDTMAEDYTFNFSTPALDVAPSVTSTTPTDDTEGVAVGSNITINFSESVNANSSSFNISCVPSGVHSFDSFDSPASSFVLDPDVDFDPTDVCEVTVVAANISDADANDPPDTMAEDYTFNFNIPVPDLAPTVVSTVPDTGATGVLTNATLTVNFSEDVTTGTVPEDWYTLECPAGSPVTATSSGTGASRIITPDAPLPYSTTCTATILAAQVTDQDGTAHPMAANHVWTFSTTYDPDPDAITPIGIARAAGAGWTGNIQGNVTVTPGTFGGTAFAIQDDTGGMYIYPAFSAVLPSMSLGDLVTVKGTIKLYNGLLEIDPVASVTRVDAGTVPAPEAVATNSVADTQGQLIQVSGSVTLGTPPVPGASNFTFSINDGSGSVNVFIDKDTSIDMRGFTTGQQVRIVGLSNNYNAAQVMPRYQSDVVDLTPPTVTSTVPTAGATGVSLYKPVTAAFSKAMNPATITDTSFTIVDNGGTPVTGVVTYAAATNTATFTPDTTLAPTTLYTATLSTAVQDPYGVALAAPYVWTFTTGAVDATAPTIVTRFPAASAVDVPISSDIVVTFSEELHAGSIDLSHFILTGPYGAVPMTISYNTATFAVTLTPTTNLLPTTVYTMKVTANTADLAGNPLGADDVWTFTTAVEPPMVTYFGDLHNHTSYSDGSGDPTQALAAGKAAGFDFMAISDHSYAISDAEWSDTLNAVNGATNADFVALRGFEYTQGAEGHINVWNSVRHATRTNVVGCTYCDYTPNLEAGATVQGFYPWLVSASNTALDDAGMVMQFNHPGWINFNDWTYHPEVSEIARLEEVGNGSGASYVFSEEEFLRSLDYGWKLGATNNADTHSAYWGVNTDHRTGVLMPELTKDALLEAMRLRRTFATEDKNFSLSMKANGSWMGSEIANSGQIEFEIQGSDPDGEIASLVELITDQGVVANTFVPTLASFTWSPLETITTGVHYFYVKVTQADGDLIVTSPIWTMGTEDISITDIVIQPTIPTIYSPSLITARVTNRVAESRTVNVVVSVNGVPLGTAQEVIVPANGDGYVNFTWNPSVTGDATVTAEILNAPAGDNPDDNTASLQLTVTDEHLPLILIDAGHGNLNAAGNEMKAFVDDLSAHHFNVLKNLDGLTAADLNPDVVKLLIITAPKDTYTADEQTAIGNFVNAGGSLWILGVSDYSSDSDQWELTVADRENAILTRVEEVTGQDINMRMNDDEVIDGNTNNGYVFGVVWGDFPSENTTGIGINVDQVATWSLASIRGRDIDEPLTADTPGVEIIMQGDLETGCTADSHKNPLRTSNIDNDKQGDAYIYNSTWTCDMTTPPADALPVPAAAVTDLPGTAGRIMLYGDSNDPFTTFAYTAGDGRQNELFNLQSVMWLLGTPLTKSTVAEARAQAVEDQPDELGNLVWVEGEITAAYGEFFNVLYLRDETGGITVHAPAGDIDPAAFTRGTRVRAIGTIGIYNGDTEIEFFEAEMVQVISPSTGEPAPTPLTTLQATLEANEGSLVKVSGFVTAKSGTDTIFVNDGSGPVRVFLDGYNGSLESIAVGEYVSVIGLASEDGDGSRIRVRNYQAHVQYPDDIIINIVRVYLPIIAR